MKWLGWKPLLSLSAPPYEPVMTWHLSHNAKCKSRNERKAFVTVEVTCLLQSMTHYIKLVLHTENVHRALNIYMNQPLWNELLFLHMTHFTTFHISLYHRWTGTHYCNFYIFLQWARCRCFTRHELWLNDLLHISQLKGFSPVWTRRCLERAALSTKPLLHISHLYGLSPVCVRLCVVREPLWANRLLHTLNI